jgi:spore maturation protein CgeB
VVPTLNWFSDDQYRFEEFARPWTPCFNWVVTTSQAALPKYHAAGLTNVIKSQWACNPFTYHPLNLPLVHDVTFVGQRYAERQKFVQHLRDLGINVAVWGHGWDTGRADQAEMIRIFNQSRINLNFAGGGMPLTKVQAQTLVGKLRRWISVNSDRVPFAQRLKAQLRQNVPAPETAAPVINTATVLQIKGRNFEIPGCGGFMLSGRAENITDYYQEDHEAAYFSDAAELAEKVRYYLAHENERAQVAKAGYARTRREHTYVHRFAEIFQKINLPSPPAEKILAGEISVGNTEFVS